MQQHQQPLRSDVGRGGQQSLQRDPVVRPGDHPDRYPIGWAQDLQAVRPYDPGRPCEIEVVFTTPDRLEEYRHRRGVEVTGPSTIVSRGDDWWQAWSAFYF